MFIRWFDILKSKDAEIPLLVQKWQHLHAYSPLTARDLETPELPDMPYIHVTAAPNHWPQWALAVCVRIPDEASDWLQWSPAIHASAR